MYNSEDDLSPLKSNLLFELVTLSLAKDPIKIKQYDKELIFSYIKSLRISYYTDRANKQLDLFSNTIELNKLEKEAESYLFFKKI